MRTAVSLPKDKKNLTPVDVINQYDQTPEEGKFILQLADCPGAMYQ